MCLKNTLQVMFLIPVHQSKFFSSTIDMFSKISQKAALIGMTAITSFTVMGSFMIDSAQAAQSSIFNSEAVAENSVSSLNTSQLEVASFIRRGKIRQKPTAGY